MMVIDTVHSSGVGRMHGGMKIARPVQSSQGPESKLILTPGMVAESKKDMTIDLDSSRPGLVIRRRIMVRQSEEADEAAGGRFHGLPPALSNQPNAATTTSVNHSHGKMDHSSKLCDIAVARSSSTTTTTQDQFDCKSPPMTKPPKTLLLFDLNKLPTLQESVLSPAGSSPTSTIDSADSATHFTTDDHAPSTSAMATRSSFFMGDTDAFFSSSPSMKRFRDGKGGALAVDLGVLAPTASESGRHDRNIVEDDSRHGKYQQQFAFRKPQAPCEADFSGRTEEVLPSPARKRLRKLSEYAGGTTSMAKPWSTGDGDGCNNRDDVTKSRRRRPDFVVDDEEVLGAVAALLMMSSAHKRRRDFPFPSNGEASSAPNGNSTSTFADSYMEDEEATRSDLADSDNEAPSRSLGSGSSVLLRPRNKQRYRSMTEIMAQTPILTKRRAG